MLRAAVALTLILGAWGPTRAFGQVGARDAVSADEVKAAFLYNFAKFAEWPQTALGDPGDPLRIGVVADDAFVDLVNRVLQGKEVEGRPVKVVRFDAAAGLSDCHLVFIGSSEKAEVRELLRDLGDRPVLTVTDRATFDGLGIAILLLTEKNRMRFAIDVTACDRAGVRLSSKLLQLAKSVRR